MSIREYVNRLDERQLAHLAEVAKERREEIAKSGWVTLWTVSDDGINYAWFIETERDRAVAFATALLPKVAAHGRDFKLCVEKDRYRPDEVQILLADTEREWKRYGL